VARSTASTDGPAGKPRCEIELATRPAGPVGLCCLVPCQAGISHHHMGQTQQRRPRTRVTLTTHDQTMSITLLSRCDLGAAHVAMRYRTTNLSQIRIRRTKPTRATSPRRRADVTRPAPTGTPPSRTWNYDRLAAPCAEPVVAQHGRARGALPHVTRYWARPDIAYLPVTDLEPAAVRAGVAEGRGERAHPGPGRGHP
jgi:hypothetical protein